MTRIADFSNLPIRADILDHC